MTARFADLGDLPYARRVEVLGSMAQTGAQIAFVCEDTTEADRYLADMTAAGYKVAEVDRCPGPNGRTIVRITKKV